MKLYLVTSGDGTDGSEWFLHNIFTTREGAEEYIKQHNIHRPDWASLDQIEEWPVDQPFTMKDYPNDPPKERV